MSAFWDKSQEAASSAELLLAHGHGDGAVSRAYYAMFYAARATLERIDPASSRAKRHATLIGQFSRHVVRGQGLDPALGRMLNLAFDQRLIADYEPEVTRTDDAREVVEDMARFLSALAPLNNEPAP